MYVNNSLLIMSHLSLTSTNMRGIINENKRPMLLNPLTRRANGLLRLNKTLYRRVLPRTKRTLKIRNKRRNISRSRVIIQQRKRTLGIHRPSSLLRNHTRRILYLTKLTRTTMKLIGNNYNLVRTIVRRRLIPLLMGSVPTKLINGTTLIRVINRNLRAINRLTTTLARLSLTHLVRRRHTPNTNNVRTSNGTPRNITKVNYIGILLTNSTIRRTRSRNIQPCRLYGILGNLFRRHDLSNRRGRICQFTLNENSMAGTTHFTITSSQFNEMTNSTVLVNGSLRTKRFTTRRSTRYTRASRNQNFSLFRGFLLRFVLFSIYHLQSKQPYYPHQYLNK